MTPLHIISLGAGVQSSTMALMFKHGELSPMPDCAIFADTKAEPTDKGASVLEWLDYLKTQLPFPVHTVVKDDGLLDNIVSSIQDHRFAGAPFFTESDNGREGILRRQCTNEFKIQPIIAKLRSLVGLAKGQRAPANTILATQFIGISWMKP